MILIILTSILLVILTYVYVRWIQVKQYWAKHNVPYTPPYPLLGSMTFITKENCAVWFRRIYNSFKEPYVGIWIFWRPALLINSTEIAKNILVKDHANFRNRLATSGTTDPVGKLNLVTLDDPLWTAIRKRLSFFFTSAKLRGIQTLVTEKSNELVKRIDKENKKSNLIDLRKVMTDFTTDLIGTASFGVVSDATLTGTSHLRTITEKFMKYSFYRGLSWCSIFFIPELVDFFRFKMFPTESTEYMRKIFRKIIAQRGGLENKVLEPRDLLDILIKIKQEPSADLDMTENMMLAQASVFLQGGFDSTGTTLTFAIYELAFCPEAQVKLYEELKQAKDSHGDNFLNTSVLCQLTYLNCIISETLRKYPIMGWIDRVAIADYKIDEQLTIKAGTPVFVNAVGMHYDPDLYPEPERFNPGRFLPENVDKIKAFSYLPFGEGPRKCIGQRIGLSYVRHGLAAVILNYEVKPFLNSPKPSKVTLDAKGLFLAPGEHISVEFIPRKWI